MNAQFNIEVALNNLIGEVNALREEVNTLRGEANTLKEANEQLERHQSQIHQIAARAYNQNLGDGTFTKFVLVPFNDGSNPTDAGLPALKDRGDISELDTQQLEAYVTGYGGAGISGNDNRLEYVCRAIGAPCYPLLQVNVMGQK